MDLRGHWSSVCAALLRYPRRSQVAPGIVRGVILLCFQFRDEQGADGVHLVRAAQGHDHRSGKPPVPVMGWWISSECGHAPVRPGIRGSLEEPVGVAHDGPCMSHGFIEILQYFHFVAPLPERVEHGF